jgi:O-succinylbenzoic acid--CoA ligase
VRDPLVLTTGGDPDSLTRALEDAWSRGRLVGLARPQERTLLERAIGLDPSADRHRGHPGPGVVVGSGGSTGGRHWCLQPLGHLRQSADACGHWLSRLHLDPAACLHLNPLPPHHVSGLLPLVRVRRWGGEIRWLSAAYLRKPEQLPELAPHPAGRPVLLSLVPTQLHRLMVSPSGMAWLKGCSLIWVGGATLPRELEMKARTAGLPLAPCYGATETAAMVCALPPQRFLAGEEGCGDPLEDVQVRIDPATGAVEVHTTRLSPGRFQGGRLQSLPRQPGGWWRSGDGGHLGPGGLQIHGRLDGAIQSGGETVFPDVLERRLNGELAARGLSVEAVLLLPRSDSEWGERLVALIRPHVAAEAETLISVLQTIVAAWPAPERPHQWVLCPELAISSLGKWERSRWQQWLHSQQASDGVTQTTA